MSRINTNLASLTAQTNLANSQSSLQTSLTRLSTGLRINSGKDDPGGLIASELLGSEVTSIGQSIANSQRADNIVATADSALGQVSSLLNDIQGLVEASANKGAVSSSEIAANQVQLDSDLASIQRIGQTTVFGGQSLLNGSLAFSVNATGGSLGAFQSSADITINSFDPSVHTSSPGDDVTIAVTHAATKKTVVIKGLDTSPGNSVSLGDLSTTSTHTTQTILGSGAGSLASLAGTVNETVTFSVTGDKGTATGISVKVADIQADSANLVSAINAVADQTGVYASGSGAGGTVTLRSSTVGASATASITATASDHAGDDTAFNTAVSNGTLTAGTTASSSNQTTLELIGDKGRAVVTVDNDAVLNHSSALVNAINAVTTETGITASSTGGAGADVTLTSANYGSAAVVTANAIAGTVAGDITTFNAAGTQTATAGTDAAGTVTTNKGSGNFSAVGQDISYSDSAISLNASTDPTLGALTANFDVTGGALFQIGAQVNYANQINVNIAAIDIATLGRNNATTGNASLASLQSGGANALSSSDLTTAASLVQQAINQVATLRGQLGALQRNVLESNIASQQTGLQQVTAAQSNIRDTDFAKETANLTRAQVLVQAGTSVLAIANSAPQAVLSLLPRG
jgi:flagellin